MSQFSASRWPVAALGLLLGVFLLMGGTCESVLNPPEDTGATAGQTNSPPLIEVVSPTTDVTVFAGAAVQIRWTDTDLDDNARVEVFYDTDTSEANGVQAFYSVDEDPDGAADMALWDTTGVAAGTYYVGARISDGTSRAASYAVGRVIVQVSAVGALHLSLDTLGNTFKGCTFEGFSFTGYLGRAMAGRFDISGPNGVPDGISDFILVAPTADAYYVQEPQVGEAYLLFGRGGSTDSGWYAGGRYSVNAVGTLPTLPGTILTGPDFLTSSSGIVAVQPLQDADGDGGAELMLGIPSIKDGLWEDQDYDIPDNGGRFLNAPYAYPFPFSTVIPDEDDQDDYGTIHSTGYIVVLASTSPLFDPLSRLGFVLPVDEIGQNEIDREWHPRLRFGVGLRWYPRTRLPAQYDFMNNDNLFGAAMGTEDVDGDGTPEWLIGGPMADAGLGNIEFIWPTDIILWTTTLSGEPDCHSWPYGRLLWPGQIYDQVRGDPSLALTGQLNNPVGLGDVNLDGLGDFAVSAPMASLAGQKPEAGAAYLIFGRAPFGDHSVGEIKNPVVQNALSGIMVLGTAAGDHMGAAMAGLGVANRAMPGQPRNLDFNADGVPDWVVAAPGRDVPGRADVGAIAIIWGNPRKDGRFTWDQIGTDDLPGVIITGVNQGDEFGTYMATAGDVNGDGSDDLLVAAPGAENPLTGEQDTGAVYVIYGPPSSGAIQIAHQQLRGTYPLGDLLASGPVRVRVYYGADPGHRIGPVAGAGDVDVDGYEDILIADPLAAPLGRTDAGQVYLVFGEQL